MKTTPTHYIKENVRYDRITSVINYFVPQSLVDWQLDKGKTQAKKEQKIAKQIGTRVHNLTIDYDNKGKYYLTPNDSISIKNCMRAYKDYIKTEQPKFIATEYTMFNEDLKIAGTMDRKIPNEIIDIKTSSKIRLDYWIQLAMYNYLDKENSKRLGIVRLDKTIGIYEYKYIEYDRRLVNLFIALLSYYRMLNPTKEKGKVDNGDTITYPEISNRLGLQKAEIRDDWGKWYREV